MALPLKSGADFYTQQALRMALHNEMADLSDHIPGSIYFNNHENSSISDRIRYRGQKDWHSVANMEDISRLDDLIKALSGSSSESVASVLGRVITLEGYFSNGKAKDADLLDGHNSDYFATASGLSALQEKVSAFLDGEADSDAVLENLKEIQAFLDSYDGATSLADMFGAVNTQIADRYTKAEADARYLQLTGGIVANTSNAPLKIKTDSESAWVGIEYLNNLGEREGSIGVYGGKPIFVPAALDKIWTILHSGNYSDLITDLNKNLNVPSITIGGIKLSVVEGQLQIEGDAFATGQLSSGGIGSEGSGSGASGIVILEDWEKYDDTLAQVLGAGLGVGLRDKIAALESKATNVSVAQTLTSGKEIGAITIDGVATKLFAPDDYISTSGGTITGLLTLKPQGYHAIDIVSPDNNLAQITMSTNDTLRGFLQYNANFGFGFHYSGRGGLYVASDGVPKYVDSSSAKYPILHEDNFNLYALPITGGTISSKGSSNFRPLTIDSEFYSEITEIGVGYKGVVYSGFGYANGYTFMGVENGTACPKIGLRHSDNAPIYSPNNFGNVHILLHSGNYDSVLNDAYFRVFSGGTYNANTISAGGIYRVDAQYEGGESWPIPPAYGNAIHVKVPLSDTAFQIAAPQFSTQRLFFRSFANSTQATQTWKEFAFTDSNVASATKLQNARSLWGNSFNGTADINGDIHLAADKGIVASNGYAVLIAPSYLLLGYAQSELGQTTYLDGNDIYIRYGKNHVSAMYINSSGNVTIGSSDLASTSKKLYVQGDALIEKELFGANTADSSVLGWRLFANADAAYLQAGKVTGSQNGNLYFTGLYGATLSSFIVYSDSSEMKGRLLVGGAGDDGVTALQVHGDIALRRGVSSAIGAPYDINNPTIYNRIIFDGATYGIRYYSGGWTSSVVDSHTFYVGLNNDAALVIKNNKDVHISGNLVVDGEVSAGGVATEGTGGAVGGGSLDRVPFTIPVNTTSFTCKHNLGTREISVSIYEDGNDFQQVLADVYLDSTNVARIVFGSATDVVHKVVIIG